MSTGVDAQSCHLIVLDRRIASMTEFKQIIGRGTRMKLNDYSNLARQARSRMPRLSSAAAYAQMDQAYQACFQWLHHQLGRRQNARHAQRHAARIRPAYDLAE